jgi:hypothetical protein
LLRQVPPDIIKTDMLTFAKFWRARDRLEWSLTTTSLPEQVLLQVKSDDSVSGLTFEFQRLIATVSGGATLFPDTRHVVLPELGPGRSVSFRITYLP